MTRSCLRLCAGLIFAAAPVNTAAQSATPAVTDPDVAAFTDSVAAAALRNGPVAGLSIAVLRGSDTLVFKGYGYADLENDVAAAANTVYRLGSLTKQFTAAAILKLVQRGKLALDDPLTRFLPDYPMHGDTITIRELLNHTSGIPNYTDLGDKFWSKSRLDLSHQQLLYLFENEPLDFPPGTKWSYSNSGYYVLGMVIEKLSDESYADYLQKNLFDPLGLSHTYYCRNQPLIEHRAEGYATDAGHLVNDEPLSMTSPFSAGALCSTIGDLVRWTARLHGGRVVSPASYHEMTTPPKLPDGKDTGYGFGLGIGALNGHRRISHGGGINGFATYLSYYPDDRVTIVVLANTEGGIPGQIEGAIAREIFGLEQIRVADLPTTPEQRARYAGTYDLGNIKLRIFDGGDRLMAQGTDQPAIELLYQGNDTFAAKVDPNIRIVFNMKDGTAASLTLHQGPRTTEARRVEGSPQNR